MVAHVRVGVLDGEFFFFQAEDGIRDYKVTGVQTCALPISLNEWSSAEWTFRVPQDGVLGDYRITAKVAKVRLATSGEFLVVAYRRPEFRVAIGRGACRERGEISAVALSLKKKKIANDSTEV